MNPYGQINPIAEWLIEHPGIGLLFTVLWLFWVAGALGFICFQLYKHNEREQLKETLQQILEEERQQERRANPFKQEHSEKADAKYMPSNKPPT
jgi:hypothetical protein